MNAIIKYPGSKWRIAKWIIDRFPKHHSYLEPFFGSGAVLFTKPRSNIETVNDLDDDVVNFFDWIKKDPERLAQEIYMTPYARTIFDRAWDARYTEADSFMRAVYFCERMMFGHGFRTNGVKVGWKNDIQGREAAYATRYGAQYKCEMTDSDHEELIYALKNHKGPVLLSGYRSPMYDELLKDWRSEEISVLAQSQTKRTEVLWMNFENTYSLLDVSTLA